MIIVGLTGAMGAGKSNLARYLHREGIPLHCADQEIHNLLASDAEIQKKVKALWPDVFVEGSIDRNKLGNRTFFSSQTLTQLEDLLYPKLLQRQRKFLVKNQKLKTPLVVFDAPLLCEVGLDRYCHFVLMAYAPPFLRKQRVLRRKGMTQQKFQMITSHQMKDQQRRKYVDFIIPTGREKGSALKRIRDLLDTLLQRPAPFWQGRWPIKLKREPYVTRNRFRH
ncbi:MAG: dephospho-CoA kinase [Alphaproteobacteria bacterium]|nr:dephospho-CoA kinase [Alphaproteobacteria bacterium]